MSAPTLTIVTGLPGDDLQEYAKNLDPDGELFTIPDAVLMKEKLLDGKHIILANSNCIKYSYRNGFMGAVLDKIPSVQFKIFILIKPRNLLTHEDFKILQDFEIPTDDEPFNTIKIVCDSHEDNLMYTSHPHTELTNKMRQIYGTRSGYASGAGVYDIGCICITPEEFIAGIGEYISNISAYIVAGLIHTIRLNDIEMYDWIEKQHMLFIINYSDYLSNHTIKEVLSRFGESKTKALMTFDVIRKLTE